MTTREAAALDFLLLISSSKNNINQESNSPLNLSPAKTLPSDGFHMTNSPDDVGDKLSNIESPAGNSSSFPFQKQHLILSPTRAFKELSVREQAATDFLGGISLNNDALNPSISPQQFAIVPSNSAGTPWRSEDDLSLSGNNLDQIMSNTNPLLLERAFTFGSFSQQAKASYQRKSLNRLSAKSARSSEMSLMDPLIVFTCGSGGPVSLFSMIPLRQEGKRRQLKKNNQKSNASPYYFPYLERMGLSTINFDAVKLQRKKMAESYGSFLEPQGLLDVAPNAESSSYDPYYLDHPDLRAGKNKTVITLPCFLGTIIQPSTASEIKKELNQHFKEAHPGIDSTITLSQIRNLKSTLCKIGAAQDLEPSSIAFAFVYLEKLILKNFVSKSNKRLIASICLLLAVKVNDAKDINYSALVEAMEKEMEVPRKEVYGNEFSVYCELEFSLFLPIWEVKPHLARVDTLMLER